MPGTPTPADIISREIEHALRLIGVNNAAIRRVVRALNLLDRELEETIAVGAARARRKGAGTAALAALLSALRVLNRRAVNGAFSELEVVIRAFAKSEAKYTKGLLEYATGAEIAAPKPAGLAAVLAGLVVLGESIVKQAARFAAFRYGAIADALRGELAGGKPIDAIIDRAMGSGGPVDRARGTMGILTRTDNAAAGQVARNAVYAANPGVVIGQYWSAILDDKTTPVCRANDGATRQLTPEQVEQWEESGLAEAGGADDKGPFDGVPWSNGYRGPYPAHYGERSIIVPLVNRAAPDKLTFEEWFETKRPDEQEAMLGKARYALWKSGRFELSDFVNDRGRTLTLKQLRAQDVAAFDAATKEGHPAAARKAGAA